MQFDDTYLNQTVNKTARGQGFRPEFIVYHETASPNPNNPHGTLKYNLARSVGSSYHYLIARNGTIYRYLDESLYIAWHAGKNSRWRGYAGADVNTFSIGIELDGANNGTPITAAQRASTVDLVIWLCTRYGIPLLPEFHPRHSQVAPGYKSDPRGADPVEILADVRARMATAAPPPKGMPYGVEVHPRLLAAWQLSGGVWQQNKLTPGYPVAAAHEENGAVIQRFERSVARCEPDGRVSWLLLSEIQEHEEQKQQAA